VLVTVSFELTHPELRRGLAKILRKRRVWLAVQTACLVALGISFLQTGRPVPGGLILAVAWLYLVTVFAGPYMAANKAFDTLCIPTEMTFTDESYTAATSMARAEINWRKLVKTEEHAEFFLLYLTQKTAVIVPKRAFSVEDAAVFGAFLNAAPWRNPVRPELAQLPEA